MQALLHTHYLIFGIITIMLSALITLIFIPSILHVARIRHLYDDVGHFRKQHDHGIPRLGGVAIFVSFMITLLLYTMINKNLSVSYIFLSGIILFMMGIKDDLSGVNPSTKFFIQFIVAAILVVLGDIRFTGLYGVLDINTVPYVVSVTISILFIMMVINAFNLIDGINGLAGTICIIVNTTFAALFIFIKHYELAVISLAITGAVLGFLRYNLTQAQIFMGDAGSLIIGLITSIMAIKFIALSQSLSGSIHIPSSPALTLAIIIVPVFDTLRVFSLRIISGISPFTADRNHIHHRMLKLGYTHLQTTFCLAGINIVSIIIALLFSPLGNSTLILLIFSNILLFNWTVTLCIRVAERQTFSLRSLFV